MNFSAVEIWFAIGIIFILLEFTAISGIGLLLLGFGALSTSILIYFIPELKNYQIAIVGISSLAWFIILWWPLKTFMYNKDSNKKEYFNIVGMQVEVVSADISPHERGKVYWSGTTMNAKFVDETQKSAKVGEKLYVISVEGNILLCSRKKP